MNNPHHAGFSYIMQELTAAEGPEEDQGQGGPGGKEDGGIRGAVQGHNGGPGAG